MKPISDKWVESKAATERYSSKDAEVIRRLAKELLMVREEIRKHKALEGGPRSFDAELYNSTLPEGSK